MLEEKQDEQSESSPELEQALESTPPVQQEQQVDPETATPQEAESQQEEQPVAEEKAPLHEHPRFKEVIDEKNWYKQQLETQLQQRQSQQQLQQPQTPDPYAHLTPDESRWYRDRDKQVQEIARKEAEKYFQTNVKPVIDAGRMEIARVTVGDFRRSHPDIKPNSPDEIAIAEKINMGYVADDAYWAIMGPRGVQRAEGKVKQQFKKTFEAKKKANVESSGMPAKTGLPAGKQTTRQRAEDAFGKLTVEEREALGF